MQSGGEIRINTDYADLTKNIDWFDVNNETQQRLTSLSSDWLLCTNCDNVKEIGLKLQKILDNTKISDAEVNRFEKTKTLLILEKFI